MELPSYHHYLKSKLIIHGSQGRGSIKKAEMGPLLTPHPLTGSRDIERTQEVRAPWMH